MEPNKPQRAPAQPPSQRSEQRPIEERIDLDRLADAVARLLRRDMEIARERLGRPRGRR